MVSFSVQKPSPLPWARQPRASDLSQCRGKVITYPIPSPNPTLWPPGSSLNMPGILLPCSLFPQAGMLFSSGICLAAWLASFRSLLKWHRVGFCGAGNRTRSVAHALSHVKWHLMEASWAFTRCNTGNVPWDPLCRPPSFSCKALTVAPALLVALFSACADSFGPFFPHLFAHCDTVALQGYSL